MMMLINVNDREFDSFINSIQSLNVSVFNLIGKGLTLVNSVIEGKYMERFNDAQTAKQVRYYQNEYNLLILTLKNYRFIT